MTGNGPLPLEGVTVIAVEQAVAAPFATRQLADLGARVIKIERPDGGDFARRYDETVLGEASYFVWLNRSKESLTLDLKSDRGAEILETLLSQADVLVHNLGPGVAERLKLDAHSVAQRHRDVIVCTISGYGATGTDSTRKAYDLLIQGETGLLSLTGTPDAPAKVGISIADIAAGMYAYSGILTALLRRAVTGVTGAVDVSLFDALAEWMGAPWYYTYYGGVQPARVGAQHATIAPYGPFDTADGSVLLAVQNQREWTQLCRTVIGRPDLIDDPRFATNSARVAHREDCNALIAERLRTMTNSTTRDLLDSASIASAQMNSVAEFLSHRSLDERRRWQEVDTPAGPVRALLPPVSLQGVAADMRPVPALGEHNEAILGELGYGPDAISDLVSAQVISSKRG